MRMHRKDGLGGSILLYVATLGGVLGLVALPVYFFNGGTTYENPGLAAYHPPPGASLIRQDDPSKRQFAILARDSVVTPDQIAAISAKSKKADKTQTASRREPRQRQVDAGYATEPAQRRGFFNFF